MQLVDVFRARVVDVAPDSLIIEITGADEKIDGLLEILRPFGVLEVAKTGCLAMTRGATARVATTRRPAPPRPRRRSVVLGVETSTARGSGLRLEAWRRHAASELL